MLNERTKHRSQLPNTGIRFILNILVDKRLIVNVSIWAVYLWVVYRYLWVKCVNCCVVGLRVNE